MPYVAGLRAGRRWGPWTIRPGIGAEVGATPAHLPIWFGTAILYALGPGGEYGFVALELDADGGRQTPFIVAPDFLVDTKAIGLPFRVGFAVPYVVGAPRTEPSIGVYIRVLVQTETD